MKNKKLLTELFISFILLVISNAAVATSNPGLFVSPANEEKQAFVTVLNQAAHDLKLVIIDNEDNQLYTTRIREAEPVFRKSFEFSQVPAGTYTIALLDKEKQEWIAKKSVAIHSKGLSVVVDKPKEEPVSYFQHENGRVVLSYLNFHKDDVQVGIYNQYGDKVFTESLGEGLAISRKYDISALPEGLYRVKLTAGNQQVINTIDK